MTALGFLIHFHSAFRVGGAYPMDGIDAAATASDPLPADSLKGVMRAAGTDLLGPRHPLIAEVFGDTRTPSAWSWTPARPVGDQAWTSTLRHRVEIDPWEFAAAKEHLVLAEQVWAPQARFTIERTRYLDADRARRHAALLRVAAGSVHGLGAWRRRGLGWVQICPEAGAVTGEDVTLVLALAAHPGPAGVPATGPAAGGER